MINLVLYHNARVVQYTQINKCITAHKQNQGKNHMIMSVDTEETFHNIQHPS
jgi:hypothetical protein